MKGDSRIFILQYKIMRLDIINEIGNYIDYLYKVYKYEVTIHPIRKNDFLRNTPLIRYSSHYNIYCQQFCTNDWLNKNCRESQLKRIEMCNKKRNFLFTCFAGITEYTFPYFYNNELIGYISAGCFYEDRNTALNNVSEISEKFGFKSSVLKNLYLRSTVLLEDNDALLKTLVAPLCSMVELAYIQNQNIWIGDTDDSFYNKCLMYIRSKYTCNISLSDMATELNCSKSYISHFFKKQCGLTIPEYVNLLRTEQSKIYLESTKMTIQEIAFAVGFSSSNYFSTVFKNKMKLSPIEYRTKIQELKSTKAVFDPNTITFPSTPAKVRMGWEVNSVFIESESKEYFTLKPDESSDYFTQIQCWVDVDNMALLVKNSQKLYIDIYPIFSNRKGSDKAYIKVSFNSIIFTKNFENPLKNGEKYTFVIDSKLITMCRGFQIQIQNFNDELSANSTFIISAPYGDEAADYEIECL